MIQPIRYNTQMAYTGSPEQEKPSVHKKFANFLHGVNNVTGTTQGIARGVVDGVGTAAIVGLIGKNIKNAKGNIYQSLVGIAKDLGKATVATLKIVPNLITKAPIENAKKALKLPVNFYTKYLKGNKMVAALATAGALTALALRTIQGKINANKNNAEVDHKLGLDHTA